MHAQALSQTRENLTQKHLASTRGAALLHNRIINLWNAPAAYIVTARSVSRFKRYLRNYANNTGTDFFLPLATISLWYAFFAVINYLGRALLIIIVIMPMRRCRPTTSLP